MSDQEEYVDVIAPRKHMTNGRKRIGRAQYAVHAISIRMIPYLRKEDLRYIADQLGIENHWWTSREELVFKISQAMKNMGSYARAMYLPAAAYSYYKGALLTEPYKW